MNLSGVWFPTWVGIVATLVTAFLQIYLVFRFEKTWKQQKWAQARAIFFSECFILSGDLISALARYTAKKSGRVYVCDNMEFPLHEIINRTNHLYSQARINSSGLNDQESAALANLMSKLRFASTTAQDALRSWDVIEDVLPDEDSVDSDHELHLVPTISTKAAVAKKNKHVRLFASNIRECSFKILEACGDLSDAHV